MMLNIIGIVFSALIAIILFSILFFKVGSKYVDELMVEMFEE